MVMYTQISIKMYFSNFFWYTYSMSIKWIIFIATIVLVVIITWMLMWHWKTYMPESGKGLTIFTIYIIGVAVCIIGLFGAITLA